MIPSEPAPSDDPAALQAMLAAERLENDRLRKIIRELQRHRFVRRSVSGHPIVPTTTSDVVDSSKLSYKYNSMT